MSNKDGKDFWLNNFVTNEKEYLYHEVKWSDFREAYCRYFSLSPTLNETRLKSLEQLLVINGYVTISDFGRICDVFRVMQRSGLELVDKIMTKS